MGEAKNCEKLGSCDLDIATSARNIIRVESLFFISAISFFGLTRPDHDLATRISNEFPGLEIAFRRAENRLKGRVVGGKVQQNKDL